MTVLSNFIIASLGQNPFLQSNWTFANSMDKYANTVSYSLGLVVTCQLNYLIMPTC